MRHFENKAIVKDSTTAKFGEVAEMENYQCYRFFGCLLSEPKKYLGTHLIIMLGMVGYYACSARYQNIASITITAFIHFITVSILVILAFKDPGIIPKILPDF